MLRLLPKEDWYSVIQRERERDIKNIYYFLVLFGKLVKLLVYFIILGVGNGNGGAGGNLWTFFFVFCFVLMRVSSGWGENKKGRK